MSEEKKVDTGKTASEVAAEVDEAKKVEADEAAADAAAPDPEGFRNKYVGEQKIRGVVHEEDMSIITFKDNAVEAVPTILLKRIVTDKANDHGGSFSDLKMAAITKDVLMLLNKAYHLRFSELNRLTSFLNNVSENDKASANAILWGKHATQITLADVDKVLTEGSDKLSKIIDNAKGDNTTQEIIARKRAEMMGR